MKDKFVKKNTGRRLWGQVLSASLLVSASFAAQSLELVTPEEAARPDMPAGTRGVTRGPAITLESPAAARSPMPLKVAVKARGGAHIDPKSLRLTYLKTPMVDLTARVRPGISETGIALDEVTLPPGLHRLLVHVADSEGRETEVELKLDVAR